MKPTNRSLLSVSLLVLISTSWSAAQTATMPSVAPATQPAKDYNAGPSDVATAKLGRTGQPDAGFMRLHQSFLDRGKAGPIGLLFLGDSITQFWTRAKDVYDSHYSKYQPANFGISGDKTQHVLWRIDNGELDNIHPKLVVLLIGTNNFRENEESIWRGDKKIVDEIHLKLPDSKLLILGIFPRGNDLDPKYPDPLLDSRYPDGPHVKAGRAMLAAVNTRLATLDDGKNTRYLDVSHVFLDDKGSLGKDMMADYLHPTPKGYRVWADAMQPLIDEMMGGATAPAN